jgi:hypothetical protein
MTLDSAGPWAWMTGRETQAYVDPGLGSDVAGSLKVCILWTHQSLELSLLPTLSVLCLNTNQWWVPFSYPLEEWPRCAGVREQSGVLDKSDTHKELQQLKSAS